MTDSDLDRRLAQARQCVSVQRQALRSLRRQLRTTHAAASAVSDAATATRLRSRGLVAQPPVPSYPPDDL